jgi:hypothetical protein
MLPKLLDIYIFCSWYVFCLAYIQCADILRFFIIFKSNMSNMLLLHNICQDTYCM